MEPAANVSVTGNLADALAKSWWTIIAGGCLGAAVALVALHAIPQRYEARATVLAEAAPSGTEAGDATGLLLDERRMNDLVEQVYGASGGDTGNVDRARRVRSRLAITPMATRPDGITPLEVSFRDEDPHRAMGLVNGLLDLSTGPRAPARRGDTVETGGERLAEITVLERASLPTSPVAPLRVPVLLIGILVGCTILVGPLLARRFLDPPILTRTDLSRLSGIPVLAGIPALTGPGSRNERARRLAKNMGLSLLSGVLLLAVVAMLEF
jgi:receptor protein-tyrosine kinase